MLMEDRDKTRKLEACHVRHTFCCPLLSAFLLRKLTDNSSIACANGNAYQCIERKQNLLVDLDIPGKTS